MTVSKCRLGKDNTGDCNTGDWNSGDFNSGDWNSGDFNSGDRNSGEWNSGDRNSGAWNSGYYNSGDRNSGYYNTGDYNTGNHNTGKMNSGWCNSGNFNSGAWNSGSNNNGYCNSITPDECLIFNKKGSRKEWYAAKRPAWMFVELTKWIHIEDMTDEEKHDNPSYKTTRGYLKSYPDLKSAYIDSWNNTTQEDRDLTRKLPNFDEDVFEEVFGFNPWNCSNNKHEESLNTNDVNNKKRSITIDLTEDQYNKLIKILEE